MSEIKQEIIDKVPCEAIVDAFAPFLAISPRLFKLVVINLAEIFEVDTDDLMPYVHQVLREQPPIDPDDF